MSRQPTAREQDCLKALHRLGGDEKEVTAAALAARLGVRPQSVSAMLKRLAEAGWVCHRRSSGVSLTPSGLTEARCIIRRHRLLKLLLTRVLGLDWSEVDAEADALEHAVSPRVEQALSALLGDPSEDPHGLPIPTPEGALNRRRLKRLCAFQPGQSVVIREAEDDSPECLRRWGELGLVPGASVQIVGHEPLDNLFQIQVGGRVIPIGGEGLNGLLGDEMVER